MWGDVVGTTRCAPDPGSLQKTGLTSHLPGWSLLKIVQSTGLSTASEQPHGTWHTRITLPLFIKTKIFNIKHKIPVYFKPREYPSPPFHAFKAEEIITAYHFPSPHIKNAEKQSQKKVKSPVRNHAAGIQLLNFRWRPVPRSMAALCVHPVFIQVALCLLKKGNVAKLMYLLQQENWIYWSQHGN